MYLEEVYMHTVAQYADDLDSMAAVQRAIHIIINLLNP